MDVLIAETNDATVARIRGALEAAGHKVTARKNGQRAFEALESRIYDVVVLGRELRGLAATEIVRKLRLGGIHVPALILGAGGVQELIECLSDGADDYVCADDPAIELVARAEALYRRALYPAVSRRIEANGISIDEAKGEVTVDGRAVHLARIEIRVLACLAASMGKIVSRETLTAIGHGERAEKSGNALESVVKRIRRRLGAPHEERLHSVRGKGYVFVEHADRRHR